MHCRNDEIEETEQLRVKAVKYSDLSYSNVLNLIEKSGDGNFL